MKEKILITGAAGFIGSHLTRRLVNDGYDVAVLTRTSSDLSRIRDILPKITSYKGDLSDFGGLHDIVRKINPTGIFHLAVATIMSGITASAEEVIKSNFLGTVNLINALEDLDYKFLINTGSFLEYEPTELYSITKLAGTLYAQSTAKTKGRPIITFRLFTPYGPCIQKGRLVYQVILNALRNADINLSRPDVVRDFIFVEDIIDLYIEAMEKAGEHPGEVYNAGSGVKTSLDFLVNYVLQATQSHSRINWSSFQGASYDIGVWQADMTKTFSHFSWRPRYGLKEGLEKTIKWFREN